LSLILRQTIIPKHKYWSPIHTTFSSFSVSHCRGFWVYRMPYLFPSAPLTLHKAYLSRTYHQFVILASYHRASRCYPSFSYKNASGSRSVRYLKTIKIMNYWITLKAHVTDLRVHMRLSHFITKGAIVNDAKKFAIRNWIREVF
jgi:hypothetical protein